VLPGWLHPGGEVHIGARRFASGVDCAQAREVKVYLRPEDVLARPLEPGAPDVFDAAIDKIEFLGSYCLVRVRSDDLGEHPLTVYLSVNYLAEQRLDVGSRLPLRLLGDRLRVF